MPVKYDGPDESRNLVTRGRLEIRPKNPAHKGKILSSKGISVRLDGKELRGLYKVNFSMDPSSVPKVELGFYVENIDVDAVALAFLVDLPSYELEMEREYGP